MSKKIQLLAVTGLVLAVGANAQEDTTGSGDSTTVTSTATLNATIVVPGTRFFANPPAAMDFGDITKIEAGSTLTNTATFTINGNLPATVTIKAASGKFMGPLGDSLDYTAVASLASSGTPMTTTASTEANATIATSSIAQGTSEELTLKITTDGDTAKSAKTDTYTETFTVELASTN